MAQLEDIARAAIAGDALLARSLAQDWLAATTRLDRVPQPETHDATVLAVAAALIETFAIRRNEAAPTWSDGVGPLIEPLYLLRFATTMPRLRKLCETEAPEPLRRRRIFAPADYLSAA